MRYSICLALMGAGLGVLLGTTSSRAQDQSAQDSITAVSERNFDLSVPASPAFTLLGTTPENIVRPTTPRLLALALANSVDLKGILQSGLAIDAAPFQATTTLANYRREGFAGAATRFIANTQFSLGTTKSQSSDDPALRGAAALHFTLANSNDPRRNDKIIALFNQAGEAARKSVPSAPEDPGFAARLDAALSEELAKTKKQISAALRDTGEQQFLWTAAVAFGGRSDSSTLKTLRYDGLGAWTSASYGLGKRGQQLIGHARMRLRERTPEATDPTGNIVDRQDSYWVGGRYRSHIGWLRTSLEGAYVMTERTLASTNDQPSRVSMNRSGVVSLVLEPRLSEGLWLHLSLFSEFANTGGQNIFGFKTSLKGGLDSK